MSPVVAVASGAVGVGTEPVSQARRFVQLAADYRIAAWPRCSVDFTATQAGRMPVRLDDGAYNPTQTIVNLGARYRFSVQGRTVTLRVQVQNLTNEKVWSVADTSGGLVPYPPPRTALAYLRPSCERDGTGAIVSGVTAQHR